MVHEEIRRPNLVKCDLPSIITKRSILIKQKFFLSAEDMSISQDFHIKEVQLNTYLKTQRTMTVIPQQNADIRHPIKLIIVSAFL